MAYAALFLWPIIAIILFSRLSLHLAIIITITGGYLLLPSDFEVGIDLPLLPTLDKTLIPALSAAVLAMVFHARQQRPTHRRRAEQGLVAPTRTILKGWLPRSTTGFSLLTLIFVGVVVSTLTNRDTLVYGETVLGGLRPYDALSSGLTLGVLLLPLLVGRKYLSGDAAHRTLLVVLCVAGCLYALPALFEVRMSPQINLTVYGFFPHSWEQHIRGNGFRPLVFLNHGLLLGIFLACSILAATVMIRLAKTGLQRFFFVTAVIWLLFTLFLAKTLGALSIAFLLLPLAFLMPVRLQLLAAAIIAGAVMVFPMLRGSGAVPADDIVQFFASIDPERAASLEYRLNFEDLILAKANERPLAGWGGWGRWRLYNEAGRDITVSDGEWVITIGESGWLGYIAKFGLLCVPIILFFFRRHRYQVGLATSGLCLVVAANLIDLIPNAFISPVMWMIAGALLGRLEWQSARATVEQSPRDMLRDRRRPATRSASGPASELPAGVVAAVETGDPEAEVATSRYTRFAPTHRRRT